MKQNGKKKIILYVGKISSKAFDAALELEKITGDSYEMALITSRKQEVDSGARSRLTYFFQVDLKNESEIEDVLRPIHDSVALINCFAEYYLLAYGRVLQLFPYLKGPNYRTIQLATHKLKMREAFKKYIPKNIPKFMLIRDVHPLTIARLEKYVGFPCIVKPAGLTRSQLVSMCYYHEELEKTLKETYRKVKALYKENNNENDPEILVEQVIEGKLFSVDVYVNSKGRCYFTPFIEIKTGKERGHDDVYLYQQTIPSSAKISDQENMKHVIEMSIHSLGLRSSTAHVEFFKTQTGYKIVEVGARIGGFRKELLELSYGINHYLNDMLIRIGRVPIIKNKIKNHVSLIKFFPDKGGVLKKVKGHKKISEESFIVHPEQFYKAGQKVGFSKYGYKPVSQYMVLGETRAKLLGNLRKVEKTINIELE